MKEHALVLVTGVAGIGKTVLCREILKGWNSPEMIHMEKDAYMRDFYREHEPETPYHIIIQDEEKENLFLYRSFYQLVEKELSQGKTVLLDNPHVKEYLWKPEWRFLMEEICRKSGARLLFVKCRMPTLEGYRERLSKRGFKRDENKLKDDESFRRFQEYEPMDFSPPKGALEVDTTKAPEELSRMVTDYIMKSEGVSII